MEAIKQNGLSIRFVKNESMLKNIELILEAVKQNGQALNYIYDSEILSCDVIVSEAIKTNSDVLAYVNDKFKSNAEFLLNSLKFNGEALKYADDVLKSDRDFIIQAMKVNVNALEYADDYLKYDKEIIELKESLLSNTTSNDNNHSMVDDDHSIDTSTNNNQLIPLITNNTNNIPKSTNNGFFSQFMLPIPNNNTIISQLILPPPLFSQPITTSFTTHEPKVKKEKKEKKATKEMKEKRVETLDSKKQLKKRKVESNENILPKQDKMKIIFKNENIPEQVIIRISSLDSNNSTTDELDDIIIIDDNGIVPIVNGIKLFTTFINWNNVLDSYESFFNLNSLIVLSIKSTELTTVYDFISVIKESILLSNQFTSHQIEKNDFNISNENYDFQYNLQTSTMSMTFKKRKEIEEIAEMLYEITTINNESEDEELNLDQDYEIKPRMMEENIQVNFVFNFEKEDKKYILELQAPQQQEQLKNIISSTLHIDANEILNYSEKFNNNNNNTTNRLTLIETNGILSTKLKNILENTNINVKIAHHHVYYEQRVISCELFERMKNIIGQDTFSSFNHLCFLICTPDQNSLYHQTFERLERSNILPPNTKITSVSIKYRKDHLKIFEKFRNRIENEKETLFIIVADECHYAISKDGANDRIVNDQLALKHDNFFILLVSATPYNVLSVDSNIPEVYKLVNNFKDLQIGTRIQVISTNYNKEGNDLLVKYDNNIMEMIESQNISLFLQNVKEISGKITLLMGGDNSVDNSFEVGELIEYEEINTNTQTIETNSTLPATISPIKYKVKSLTRNLEMEVQLKERDLKKINISNTKKITNQTIGNIPKGKIVEIIDTIKWSVTFKVVNDESREYTVNDWEFHQLTNYDEYNIVNWSNYINNNNNINSNSEIIKDNQQAKYFSKQDLLDSLKSNDQQLIFKDEQFESIVSKIKFISSSLVLRPIMLAIDYHFWIIAEGFRLKIYNEFDAYNHFYSIIENINNIDPQHKILIELCKLIYLVVLYGKYISNMDEILNNIIDKQDEDTSSTTTVMKGEEKKREEAKIQQVLEYLKVNFKPINPERLFPILINDEQSHTRFIIKDLIDSCNYNNNNISSLKGKMKIIRITLTEIGKTIYKLLSNSISKIVMDGYIQPDILIDCGDKSLSLDQLSFISRLKLAEKLLSTEDFQTFIEKPNKLPKEKKYFEYINLNNFPCILILTLNGRQGDTFPNSLNCLDIRGKSDSLSNYISLTQEFGRLCRYIDNSEEMKPIVYVSNLIFKDLSNFRNNLLTNIDSYITKMKRMEGQKYWSIITYCRRIMTATNTSTKTTSSGSYKKLTVSYDSNRSEQVSLENNKTVSFRKKCHDNRLLLFAEPQIGKTDAFIHFLERVCHGIIKNRSERMIDVNVSNEELPHDNNSIIVDSNNNNSYTELEYKLPYFGHLQVQQIGEYSSISCGKYAKLITKTREEVYNEFAPDKVRAIHKLARIESFMTSSNYYWSKFMENLSHHNFDLETFQTFDGRFKDIVHPKSGYRTLKFGESSKEEIIEKIDLSEKMNTGLADMNYKDKLITIQLQKVFGLKIALLEACFPKEKPLISIPANKMNWFTLSSDQQQVVRFLPPEDPNGIRSWIFMPSWNRSASGLFYLKSLNVSYRQVIVVRHSEFKCYRNVLGGDFVIMSLSDVVNMTELSKLFPMPTADQRKLQYTQQVDGQTLIDYEMKDDIGGIGFSRMLIQILSYAFGLEFIWMMDDNCQHFEKIENGRKVPCSLAEVLIPLEKIVYDENKPISTITQSIQPIFKSRENQIQTLTVNDKISSFTPGKDKIALIGIRKDGYRFSSSINYKPFVNSFTICSLFLLNTKRTIYSGCIFPARRYLEDIEFEYTCLERGLYCVKSQNYLMHKPANPLRIDYVPAAPTMYEIDEEIFNKIANNIQNQVALVNNSSEFAVIKDFIKNSNPQALIFQDSFNFFMQAPSIFYNNPSCEIYVFLQSNDIRENCKSIIGFLSFAKSQTTVSFYSPNPNELSTKELILKFVK